MKRTQQKKITIEARIVRFMRLSRGISQSEAAKTCRVSPAAIGHLENGRMDMTPARIVQFLSTYKYTLGEFKEFRAGKPIPVLSIKEECLNLLDRLDENKLWAVHGLLVGFSG
ncbi:MAG: helix-turn-helix transcriptional regulator [Bdellovibrionota bacterium]